METIETVSELQSFAAKLAEMNVIPENASITIKSGKLYEQVWEFTGLDNVVKPTELYYNFIYKFKIIR